MLTHVRSLWRLPAPPGARAAGRAEVAAVVLVGLVAGLEAWWRPDLSWRWLSLGLFLVWLPTLLVRRTRPLVTAAVFAVVSSTLTLVGWTTSGPPPGDLGTAVVGLLVPYSVTRWARGRDLVTGLGLFLLVAGTSLVSQPLSPADRVGGTAVVVAAVAVGATLRTRSLLRTRQLDDVRRDERERLARDLHDTVAHHLTAIAISAQAGLAVADDDPGAARQALRRIDEEATRTLAETREVVRALRTEAAAPRRPLDDIAGLARDEQAGPRVVVTVADGLDALPDTTGAALHRIAQEAVANARRHAVEATQVRVSVARAEGVVELTVSDDGRASTRHAPGFGLIGMTERAGLLGGRLEAGPAQEGGWRVRAVLPVETVTREEGR